MRETHEEGSEVRWNAVVAAEGDDDGLRLSCECVVLVFHFFHPDRLSGDVAVVCSCYKKIGGEEV